MPTETVQKELDKVEMQRIHNLPTYLRTETFKVYGEELFALSFTTSRNQRNVVLKPFSFVKPPKDA